MFQQPRTAGTESWASHDPLSSATT